MKAHKLIRYMCYSSALLHNLHILVVMLNGTWIWMLEYNKDKKDWHTPYDVFKLT
jgi:hypothetical protein